MIAIIGILVGLLLPAVQAARESARRIQCANYKLRQLAISFHNHEGAHKHLPSGGWGWPWLGYPEYGYGEDQPGGWMYNILPFMEEGILHDRGWNGRPGRSGCLAVGGWGSEPAVRKLLLTRATPTSMVSWMYRISMIGIRPSLPIRLRGVRAVQRGRSRRCIGLQYLE